MTGRWDELVVTSPALTGTLRLTPETKGGLALGEPSDAAVPDTGPQRHPARDLPDHRGFWSSSYFATSCGGALLRAARRTASSRA
ncbi:hypothetical protein GCM10020000_26440 [Streptomyces olivoverticillatus]